MICGVDCHPNTEHCNGYCQGKAPEARPATPEMNQASTLNKIQALGVEMGSLVAELRSIPPTPAGSGPLANNGWNGSTASH